MTPSTKCIEKHEEALSLQYYVLANGYEVPFGGTEDVVKLDYGDSFTIL